MTDPMPREYDNWKLSNGPIGDECDCEKCQEENFDECFNMKDNQ